MQQLITPGCAKPELLRVYCSRLRQLDLDGMHRHVSMIANRMKKASDESGIGTPSVILFHEASLRYVFDVTQAQVVAAVEKMQKLLPSDQWVAAAFSVLQKKDGDLLNMGHLFTVDLHDSQPKREWARNDLESISEYCGNDRIYEQWHLQRWDLRTHNLSKFNAPFLSAQAPNGQRLEFRTCADVTAQPIFYDEKLITLVMANDLPPNDVPDFVSFRKGTIINDTRTAELGIHPRAFARQTHTLDSYCLKTVSIYPSELV